MKLKGTQTTVQRLEIDVHPSEIISAALKLFDKKYKHEMKGEYISDGKWWVYSFTDGHNGDDHYKAGEVATKEAENLMELRSIISALSYESW